MAETTTVISLREYVDIRFEAQEKAVNAALAAAQKAVDKAEGASEKRFEGINEFRAALSDAGRLMMPRSESEQTYRTMNEKIDSLTMRLNQRDDRGAGSNQMIAWIIAGIGAIGTVAGIVLAVT